ncbi:MAG: ribonuclease H family protein, partial [Candidatus Phytoplasma australasiaticum]|nr:ribonuclease H family protein [Candidatus Phytoplasma australasiaticum]
KLYYRLVTWRFPDGEWIKHNTDGDCKGNPSYNSYGFCLRDTKGDIIYAEAGFIGLTTNIVAEATTVLKAIQHGKNNNILNMQVESNSLIIIKFIRAEWRIPWEIIEIIENSLTLSKEMYVHYKHTYRECNQLADARANSVHGHS